MITAITIENFKGIKERVCIPIRPITLLFGPNSGGKSTIIQAIHYAREILERRNLDCGDTSLGGRFVELGGFRNFVHSRDLQNQVTLGFEFELTERMLPRYERLKGSRNSPDDLASLGWPIKARVDFSVSWAGQKPYVSTYSVHLNGDRFATVSCSRSSPGFGTRLELNFAHIVFDLIGPTLWMLDAELVSETDNEGNDRNLLAGVRDCKDSFTLSLNQNDALPDTHDDVGFSFELLFRGGCGSCFEIGSEFLDQILAKLIAGPGVALKRLLSDFRYLGPLRDLPIRDYAPPRFPDSRRWMSGLGAWDALHSASPEMVAQVSDWLSDPKRLDTGYQVRARTVKELDTDSELWRELQGEKAAGDAKSLRKQLNGLPARVRVSLINESGEGETSVQDIGVGISQILPVVVACCDSEAAMTAIEQPELHLHPRLQCELGDLLIAGALGHRQSVPDGWDEPGEDGVSHSREKVARAQRTLIVETHSEHLILRILRRIRETTRRQPHNKIAMKPTDLSVVYISKDSGQSVPRTIRVDQDGEFVDNWPDQFFELDFYERCS